MKQYIRFLILGFALLLTACGSRNNVFFNAVNRTKKEKAALDIQDKKYKDAVDKLQGTTDDKAKLMFINATLEIYGVGLMDFILATFNNTNSSHTNMLINSLPELTAADLTVIQHAVTNVGGTLSTTDSEDISLLAIFNMILTYSMIKVYACDPTTGDLSLAAINAMTGPQSTEITNQLSIVIGLLGDVSSGGPGSISSIATQMQTDIAAVGLQNYLISKI